MEFVEELREYVLSADEFEIVGTRADADSTYPQLRVRARKETEGWHLEFKPNSNTSRRYSDIFWKSGLIQGENWKDITDELENFLQMHRREKRSVAVALDTNMLLSNQFNRIMEQVNFSISKTMPFEREPIILTTQGMEYEFHHQTENTVTCKKIYPESVRKKFKLKMKNYGRRGRRGAWGRFIHEVLMERYPHLLIQSDIPLIAKIALRNTEGRDGTSPEEQPSSQTVIEFEEPETTSPYFDMVILEQLRSFASNTNAVIIFFTGDSDIAKIANQSGIKTFYVKRELRDVVSKVPHRELVWLIVTMLVYHDIVYLECGDERRGYIMCKNTAAEDVNLYIKGEGMEGFFSLSPLEKIF